MYACVPKCAQHMPITFYSIWCACQLFTMYGVVVIGCYSMRLLFFSAKDWAVRPIRGTSEWRTSTHQKGSEGSSCIKGSRERKGSGSGKERTWSWGFAWPRWWCYPPKQSWSWCKAGPQPCCWHWPAWIPAEHWAEAWTHACKEQKGEIESKCWTFQWIGRCSSKGKGKGQGQNKGKGEGKVCREEAKGPSHPARTQA